MPDLQEAWELLESTRRQVEGIRVTEINVTTPAGPLMLGEDDSGLHRLLVPLGEPLAERQDRSGRGVQIRARTLQGQGDDLPTDYADIVCLNRSLLGLFRLLIGDMVSRIEARPEQSVSACQITLDEWRELLKPQPGPMTSAAKVGLFGELWFLRQVLDRSPDDGLGLWTGPLGDRHDFRSRTASIEVKATTRREGRDIRVSGLTQLDPAEGRPLWLVWLRLEEDPGGESLFDMVSAVGRFGVSRLELARRLAAVGFRVDADEGDIPERFSVLEHRSHLVDSSFPRLTGGLFPGGAPPKGVSDIDYRVDLDAATAVEPVETAVSALIGTHSSVL